MMIPATMATETSLVSDQYRPIVAAPAKTKMGSICLAFRSVSVLSVEARSPRKPLSASRTPFIMPPRMPHIDDSPPTIIAPTPMYRIWSLQAAQAASSAEPSGMGTPR